MNKKLMFGAILGILMLVTFVSAQKIETKMIEPPISKKITTAILFGWLVPYVNATQDLDLGDWALKAKEVIIEGGKIIISDNGPGLTILGDDSAPLTLMSEIGYYAYGGYSTAMHPHEFFGRVFMNNDLIVSGNLNSHGGETTIGSSGNPGCINVRDSDDNGWSNLKTLNGELIVSEGMC